MRFAFTSFVVVAAATLALAQPHVRRGKLNFNPTKKALEEAASSAAAAPAPTPVPEVPSTNAKRFALHLPPLKPKARRRPNHGAHGGTPVWAAARAESSPLPPVSVTCNILVSLTSGQPVGYLSPVFNQYGEYGTTQSDPSGALQISFSYSPLSPNQLDITTTNGPSGYAYFGGILGYAFDEEDLGPGNHNYAYIGGTTQSPPGSTPVQAGNSFSDTTMIPEGTESAIWQYDPNTGRIAAQWINGDGSTPTIHIVQIEGALCLTGDPYVLASTFETEVEEWTLTCVPPTSS